MKTLQIAVVLLFKRCAFSLGNLLAPALGIVVPLTTADEHGLLGK